MPAAADLRFRLFEPADVDCLGPWLRRAGLGVPHGVAAAEWGRRLLVDPRIVCRVGVVGAAPVGFYRLDIAPDGTAEVTLIVDPVRRRRGFGRRLLTDALEFCRGRGLRNVLAVISDANTAGLEFFLDAGFRQVHERIPDFVHLERPFHNSSRQPPIEIVP